MPFLRPLLRYADLSGRARRTEYWGFVLFETALGGLFGILAAISLGQKDQGAGAAGFITCLVLAGVTVLALVIPHLAVTVRRLHDTNRSAWWLMLQAPAALAPILFLSAIAGVAGADGKPSDATIAAIGSVAAGAALLLVLAQICNTVLMALMWIRGTDGENRYGADPRGPDGRLNISAGSRASGLDDARLDALFAQARQAVEVATPTRSTWPDAPAPNGFGRRGA